MESRSVLPGRRGEEVGFEISPEAAAVIFRRGGNLWIWPSSNGPPYAATEPPGDRHEWTVYRQGELVVRVDAAIMPPRRWVVALPENGGRLLDARWNGLDPGGAFGRLALRDVPEEASQPSSIRHAAFQLGSNTYAVVAAALWVLGIAGLHRWWFDGAPVVGLGVVILVAFIVELARRRRRGVRGGESRPQAPE